MSVVKDEPKRRLRGDVRRERILEAATEVFAEQGYDRASFGTIAALAGVSRPVVYDHFSSKAELHLLLLERERDRILEHVAGALAGEGTPEVRVARALDTFFAYVEAHPYAWRMLFRDTGGGPEIQAFRDEVHAEARRVLVGMIRLLAERELPEAELEPLAELMSMGMAHLVLWSLDHPEVPDAAIVDAMTRVWTGLLGGVERSPRAHP